MREEDFKFILEVYNCRSISKASNNLSITPQGLSKAIRSVENEINASLFIRNWNGVVPTELCDCIIDDISDFVASAEKIRNKINRFNEKASNTVFFLGRQSPLGDHIQQAVTQYNANTKNNIMMVFSSEDEHLTEKMFKDDKFDFRFCSKELISDTSLYSIPMGTLCYYPVVNINSRLAEKNLISIEDLKDHTVLIERVSTPHFELLTERCMSCGFKLSYKEIWDKFHIWNLINDDPDYIYFCQPADINYMSLRNDVRFKKLSIEPAMSTEVVLQSKRRNIDPEFISTLQSAFLSYTQR